MKIASVKFGGNKEFNLFYDDGASYLLGEQFDNRGKVTFISNHRNYSNEGELKHLTIDQVIQGDIPEGYKIQRVFGYIHSNISLSLAPFSCPWDSGTFGFIVFEEGEFGVNDRGLNGFVKAWDALLNGEVYGFTITETTGCEHCGNQQEEEISACWGFYGFDNLSDMVKEMLGYAGFEIENKDLEFIVQKAV